MGGGRALAAGPGDGPQGADHAADRSDPPQSPHRRSRRHPAVLRPQTDRPAPARAAARRRGRGRADRPRGGRWREDLHLRRLRRGRHDGDGDPAALPDAPRRRGGVLHPPPAGGGLRRQRRVRASDRRIGREAADHGGLRHFGGQPVGRGGGEGDGRDRHRPSRPAGDAAGGPGHRPSAPGRRALSQPRPGRCGRGVQARLADRPGHLRARPRG